MNKLEEDSRKNKLFAAVDSAPFSGKFIIKDAYVGYVTADDSKKTRRAIVNAALLSVMVGAHAYQAKTGFDSLSFHLPEVTSNPDAKNVMFSSVDSIYTLAMSAVAIRQVDLLRKVGKRHRQWIKERKKTPESERLVQKREYRHSKRAMALALAVTASGQAAGGISMADADSKRYELGSETTAQLFHVKDTPSVKASDVVRISYMNEDAD